MRIAIVSSLQAGTKMANAINTVKMAQGFARLGHDVTLVCRKGLSPLSPDELCTAYGLTTSITWLQLPLRTNRGKRWIFPIWAWHKIKHWRPEFVYARDYLFPCLSSRHGIVTAGESHAHIGSRKLPFNIFLRCARRQDAFKLLVTISERLAEHYHQRGVPQHKLAVLADAVDLELFQRPSSLPPTPFSTASPNIVYAGHLYDYKGIPTILAAAQQLPQCNFHLIGGWPEDIRRQQNVVRELRLSNVAFHGLLPQLVLPPYLWHADILLLPPSQYHPSAAWTSPLKMGEYLASGSPIVATSIPALRDWLSDDEVQFVNPDDPDTMVAGICILLEDRQRCTLLAANGLARSREMSFRHRAQTILQRCALTGKI